MPMTDFKQQPTQDSVQEILRLGGADFVRAAYRLALGREPDAEGFANYGGQLRQGISRLDVLAQICDGPEYKASGRQPDGLRSLLRRHKFRRRMLRMVFGLDGSLPAHTAPTRLAAEASDGDTHHALTAQRLSSIESVLREISGESIERHVDELFKSFHGERYLEHNSDVAAAGMNPYEHWVVAGYAERRRWGQSAEANESADLDGHAYVEHRLPVPDGHWEWMDHAPVQAEILAARDARRQQFVPAPASLLSIEESAVERVALSVGLPSPPDEPDVSIVLPVFNHLALTLECLESIAAANCMTTYEVIVTDDASDPDVERVLRSVPNLRYRRNPQNLGFLRNCNAALPMVRGRWTLLLNNDVQVPKGWLDRLRDVFERGPQVGIVGPAFVYPSGHLQEAGGVFRIDGSAVMVGLNDDPAAPAFSYPRRVDYVSGACLMIQSELLGRLGGFSDEFLPCYCEDSDLCLRAIEAGFEVWVDPRVHVVHHLSRTTAAMDGDFKMRAATRNIATLARRHASAIAGRMPRVLAFYLPQFHPFPENSLWWGEGFTEWTNVSKARPNFEGHYQPRLPADLGYYDLRLPEAMKQQADLAQRYGIDGFVFYYYWFGGKRLLDRPIEAMLASGSPDFPFCLCWANENWTRRWDGRDRDLLMAQAHSEADDLAVIEDLARFLRDPRNIRVDGRPLLLVYRVTLFPDFAATAARWRKWCRDSGIGEIYLSMVESFELVQAGVHPEQFGCDAAVEFPPQGLARMTPPDAPLLNPAFTGHVASYRELAVAYASREMPAYKRFKGVMPGWDNTARRQNDGLAFGGSTPGGFQAWLADALEQTLRHQFGDERLVFVNAWNEWAEGAYLEPDRRFGHGFLQAVRNAKDAAMLRSNAPPF
ncbi:MAG: glycoside hydrolase family 99-like domain-containing protein [Rubrivivax sp.]|nr:glycoside hydrolase family 99-like domain-containing protein [Rubrivivax sp.]